MQGLEISIIPANRLNSRTVLDVATRWTRQYSQFDCDHEQTHDSRTVCSEIFGGAPLAGGEAYGEYTQSSFAKLGLNRLQALYSPFYFTVPTMISDTTLTNLSNGLGIAAMAFIVLYHFVAVNGKRMEE